MKKGTKILLIVTSAIVVPISVLVISFILTKKDFKTIEVEVYRNTILRDLIDGNIELINNPKIDTTKIGEQEIEIEYKNKIFLHKDKIKINVVDTTAPELEVEDIDVEKDEKIDITKKFKCKDNYDKNPNCFVEGNYTTSEPREYKLKYIGEDSSKNRSEKEFTLNVHETKSLSSAGYETVVCTQAQNVSGVSLDSTVNVYIGSGKFKGLDMEINIVVPDSMLSQKSTLITALKKQYEGFETRYGVVPNTFETTKGAKVTMNMTADQAKKFSGSQNDQATREDVIKVFGNQGFSCK